MRRRPTAQVALAPVTRVDERPAVQHQVDLAERQLDRVLVVVRVPAAAALPVGPRGQAEIAAPLTEHRDVRIGQE